MKIPIIPPPLKVVENESPVPTLAVQESPPAPTEQARPAPPPSNKEYIAVKDEDGDWNIVVSENKELRAPTENEARQVASMMNELGSNVVTLYCRNDRCRHKNTWIKRASEDIKRNVYICDTCKQPMVK